MVTSASTQRFLKAANRLGFRVQVREFPEGTRTAEDAAGAIGVSVGQIVKSLVFSADGRPVVCLVSGANRLDPERLRRLTGADHVERADADTARNATGYAVGGVPPFGHAVELPVYADRDLLNYDLVWAAAGTPRTVFSIQPEKLVELSGAIVADIKEVPGD
jgi:Cys-tRNA(Pro) deacylase